MKLLRYPCIAGAAFGFVAGTVESAVPGTLPSWVLLGYFGSYGIFFLSFFVPYTLEVSRRFRDSRSTFNIQLDLDPPRWTVALATASFVLVWAGLWLATSTSVPELPRPEWLETVSWPFLALASFYSLLCPVVFGWKPHAA